MTTIKKLTATTVLLLSLSMTTFTLKADPPPKGDFTVMVAICINGKQIWLNAHAAVHILANNPNATLGSCGM